MTSKPCVTQVNRLEAENKLELNQSACFGLHKTSKHEIPVRYLQVGGGRAARCTSQRRPLYLPTNTRQLTGPRSYTAVPARALACICIRIPDS